MEITWFHCEREPEGYAAVEKWISTRIFGKPAKFGLGNAMAVTKDGSPIAGVVFYDHDKDAGVIQFSAASDSKRWLTKPVLWAMFSYAFDQLGCQAIIGRNDPDNEALLRQQRAYGFKEYFIPRLRGRDKGEVLVVLHDDAWRKNGFHKEHD